MKKKMSRLSSYPFHLAVGKFFYRLFTGSYFIRAGTRALGDVSKENETLPQCVDGSRITKEPKDGDSITAPENWMSDFAIRSYLNAVRRLHPNPCKITKTENQVCIVTDVRFWRRQWGADNRIYSLVGFLVAHFDVYVFYMGKELKHDDLEMLRKSKYLAITYFCKDYEPERKSFEYKSGLTDRKQEQIAEKSQQLEEFLARYAIDTVIVEYVRCLLDTSLLYDPRFRCILDIHDLMYKRQKTFAESGSVYKPIVSEDEEIHIYNNVDAVIAIQREEGLELRARLENPRNVMVCGHPVDSAPVPSIAESFEQKNVVFIGSPASHNLTSLSWFVGNVWPLVKRSVQGVNLYVFGGCCEKVKNWATVRKDDSIILRGKYLEQMVPFSEAAITVNPAKEGSGLKIKCIESISAGIPVVATTLASEGIQCKGLVVADEAEDFGRCIANFLGDFKSLSSLRAQCLDFRREELSPERVYSPLRKFIERSDVRRQSRKLCNVSQRIGIIGNCGRGTIREFLKSFSFYLPPFFIDETLNASLMHRQIETEGCRKIWYFNPYRNEEHLSRYRELRNRGHEVFCIDRGALPDSWFFDPNGFNVASDSYSRKMWDRDLTSEERRKTENYIKGLVNGGKTLEVQGDRSSGDKLRRKYGIDRKKVLFVPLQRPNDSVIRYFSERTGGYSGFLSRVQSVAARLGDDWVVLVKKHPLEYRRPNMTSVIFADNDDHIYDLLELANAVMVINSGVGLLSMMFSKPVIIAGDAFYAINGVNMVSSDPDEIVTTLREGLSVDYELVLRFIRYLRFDFYCFGKSKSFVTPFDENGLMNVTRSVEFYEFGKVE